MINKHDKIINGILFRKLIRIKSFKTFRACRGTFRGMDSDQNCLVISEISITFFGSKRNNFDRNLF